MQGKAKTRYLEKLQLLNGVDPFLLTSKAGTGGNDAPTQGLPPVEATDLVSFLVLETSFVTAKQFKAHKSMEAYNQFVSGWVKDVCALTINQKSVVTGRVSYQACYSLVVRYCSILCAGEDRGATASHCHVG